MQNTVSMRRTTPRTTYPHGMTCPCLGIQCDCPGTGEVTTLALALIGCVLADESIRELVSDAYDGMWIVGEESVADQYARVYGEALDLTL